MSDHDDLPANVPVIFRHDPTKAMGRSRESILCWLQARQPLKENKDRRQATN